MIFFSLYLSLGHTYGPIDFNGNMLVYNLFLMGSVWIEGKVCLKGLLVLKFHSLTRRSKKSMIELHGSDY